ncbi:MAG: hypothetical protein AB1801_08940 [Chloroflexota bacterium]
MRVETAALTTVLSPSKLKLAAPPWAVIIGAALLALHVALLPLIERTWRATGDEPHYLLASHSLVADRDFDLANNYDQLDPLNFYFSRDIDRQVRLDGAGRQILDHQLGLPLLLAPAYALGGRLGVLAFQSVLGGLLAALTFKLAAFVSRDERAALMATLMTALSPPLLLYPYLVYPELAGALLTTLVLYYAVARSRPTPGAATWVILSLAMLPWLNRRFIPLAVILALLIAWTWRSHSFSLRNTTAVWGLLAAAGLSIALLLWFNSRLSPPLRADIIAPLDSSTAWLRLGRAVGWLVDQQRGLFIFAPVYILSLWGLPLLFERRPRHWLVLVPLLSSMGVVAAAGGYWVAWELGPRFLVVGLPGLAPLLALAWRRYARRRLWTAAAMLLLALSLANSLVIIRNPELPYKSSLPAFYGHRLGLPLTELLPDLAGYARIAAPASQALWFAAAGQPAPLAQSGPLYDLPAGHYRLIWPLRIDPNLPPETEVLRLSIKFLGGGQLFYRVIPAAGLPADGRAGLIEQTFTNPNIDRWRRPMILHAASTGRSNIWGQDILFSPDPLYGWLLPYLYLGLLALAAAGTWRRFRAGPEPAACPLFQLPRWPAWGLVIVLPLLALAYLAYQLYLPHRTYDAARLPHLTGRLLADPEASAGRAWQVDPRADPPQKAIYGPFDLYAEGGYHVAFRIKLPEQAAPGLEIARLRVAGATGPLRTQPLRAEHFTATGLYHDFVLVVDNPRRQALSFEVEYLGAAALALDDVTITRIKIPRNYSPPSP